MRPSFDFHFLCLLMALAACTADRTTTIETDASAVDSVMWSPDSLRDIPGMSAQRGLMLKSDLATPGYVLFTPMGTSTYLMDLDGKMVHEWKGDLSSMHSYLLEDGSLLKLERDEDFPVFAGGGQAGMLRHYSWDGNIIWEFEYASESYLTHHDMEIMPNGNILAIAWEVKSKEEAIAAGRNPEFIPEAGLWPDKIIEIEPQGPSGGRIVWEWHMWDHLVQDHDPSKLNYGDISDPRKIDINSHAHIPEVNEEQLEQMKKQGAATSNARVENQGSDLSHFNSIDYNHQLDQILISVPHYHEIWIIDHSTTTEEAGQSSGGRYNHGGDLLYRWGNPANYHSGEKDDQKLYGQHDATWIPEEYPDAGQIMVFNNDIQHPESKFPNAFAALGALENIQVSIADLKNYSAVYQIDPPTDEAGSYLLDGEGTFGPSEPYWTYTPVDKYSFYGPFVSGAHKMANGNVFITEGPRGRIFEITREGEILWEYWNPYFYDYRLPDGSVPQPVGPFKFALFRATHIPVGHPAVAGRSLAPMDVQPEPYRPPDP